jgi:putative transposase
MTRTKTGQTLIRTFRYPLHPTRAQEATLCMWLEACCDLYNGALQERRDAWRKQRRSICYEEQTRSLTELRAADPSWSTVPVEAARSALRRVDRAFKAFFRRCKAGHVPGFPRFRSRRLYDSFGIQKPVRIDGNIVYLPKIGPIRFNLYRPLRGKILDVVVQRDGNLWFVCFQCDLGEAPPKGAVLHAVGVDVGLSSLATLSTGEIIENPRCYREAEAVLRRRQQALARKQKGSLSRRRAVSLVRKAHARAKNQRLDYARKVACDLASRFDLIAFEDLNIRGLAMTPMAKSIHDAGWRILLRAIVCKAESAGKHAVAVDPRGTSQECSACGVKVQKDLSVRIHRCACGLVLDRDHNAALNILARGRRAAPEALKEAEARSPV